ncbi:hypothetical protein [Zooshikella ganghwensis]|uniref:Uncharacterized protein n=1 Tax=Zooshikella ganghwensis TaxID=202772 RepID=A0A4P9VPU1_9GAMM|nr:hypothetical protein [Zooshikella ganghwensis]RDH44986.1 hypothetical protein B9G39_16940 [Zooshikella ganghwensis]
MNGLRVSIIAAIIVLLLIVAFGSYQYLWLDNHNVIHGPRGMGYSVIILILFMVFSFIVGLISFIPAMISIASGRNLMERLLPILVALGSIGVSLLLAFQYIIPMIEAAK